MQDDPRHEEHPENLDSVPDSEQEHRGLDPHTKRAMDSMEDDEPPTAQVQRNIQQMQRQDPDRLNRLATSAMRHTSPSNVEGTDRRDRVTPDEIFREMSDGVPDHLQEAGSSDTPVPDQDLAPEQYRYRVVAVLPDPVQGMIDAALSATQQQGEVYGFQLQSAFTASEIHMVVYVLNQWAQQYLPMASRLLGVHSEIWGQNQYIAGWKINNSTAWHQAQNELTARLAPFATPEPNTVTAFRPFIGLLENTPAGVFPQLVTFLHRQFVVTDFQISQISLLRMPLPQYAQRLPAERRGWLWRNYFPLG